MAVDSDSIMRDFSVLDSDLLVKLKVGICERDSF